MERDLTKVFALLGEKWSLPILTAVLAEPRRFLALKASIPGVSQRMLAQSLKHLETNGLVIRVEEQTPTRAQYYRITKYGTGMILLTTTFQKWIDSGDHDHAQQPDAATLTATGS